MSCPLCESKKVSFGESSFEKVTHCLNVGIGTHRHNVGIGHTRLHDENLRISTDDIENLRIDTDGNVGFGTHNVGMGTTSIFNTPTSHLGINYGNGNQVSFGPNHIFHLQAQGGNITIPNLENLGLIFKKPDGNYVSLVVCENCGIMYNAFADQKEKEKLRKIKEKVIKKEIKKNQNNKFKFISGD